MPRLTSKQVETFWSEGFVAPLPALSAEALALINLPHGVESERMPPAALKGKSRQVQLYALDRTAFAERDERRQRTRIHA